MKSEAELLAGMSERQQRCEELIRLAEQDGRDHMTEPEQEELDAMLGEIRMLSAQLKVAENSKSSGRRTSAEPPRHTSGDGEGTRLPSGQPQARGGRLSQAIMAAGWDPSDRSAAVDLPTSGVFMTWPPEGDRNPTRLPDIRRIGTDERFLWPNLPSETLGEGITSIGDFRQNSRTLTGTIERALGAVTDKAVLDPGIEFVEVNLKQFALVIENIPQNLFDSLSGIQAYFDSEAKFQLDKAVDAHVITAILAAAGTTGAAFADLIVDVRNAIDTMQANGRNPDILAVTATQKKNLDLATDVGTDGGYLFVPTEGPERLWKLKIVTVSAGLTNPVLIDSTSIGKLYFGSRVRFVLDPYSGLKQNIVRMRFEYNAKMHVRSSDAALEIAL